MKKDNMIPFLLQDPVGNIFFVILETGALTIIAKAKVFGLFSPWEIIFAVLFFPVMAIHFYFLLFFPNRKKRNKEGITKEQEALVEDEILWLAKYREPFLEERETTKEKIDSLREKIEKFGKDRERAKRIGLDTEHITRELEWALEEDEKNDSNYLDTLDAIIEEVDNKITEIKDDPKGFLERVESRRRLEKIEN